MERINWARVVLGGIVAGVALLVLSGATAFVFTPHEFQQATHALNPSNGIGAALFLIFVFLSLGILMTGSYAAIRPRFGAGPRTAAIAGFVLWVIGVWISVAGFVIRGLALGQSYPLPDGPLVPCLYLAMIVASAMIGASVYREQQV